MAVRFFVRLTVALFAFALGNTAAHVSTYSRPPGVAGEACPDARAVTRPENSRAKEGSRHLSPEEAEVVTQAEHFVCWNGYADGRCGGIGRIYFEPGEDSDRWGQIRLRRRDTLEGRAYGLLRTEKDGSTVWTVVFRYAERAGSRREKHGRAYVVEDDHGPFPRRYFVNFHRDFPLAKVEKRL